MDKQKKNHANKLRLVAETLEARVLYSADSLSALGSALLQDNHDTDADRADAFAHLNNVAIPKADITEVVFIDSRVPEYQRIVDDITQHKAGSALVVVIDKTENGVDIIEKTLSELQDVDAVHVISHSLGENVRLGSEFLSINTIDKHEQSIIAWSNALSARADILIYGCDIGSTDGGIELMKSLAALTGADIGLTEDKTGTTQTGTDWEFEVSSGPLNYTAVVSYELQQSWDHALYNWDKDNRVLLIEYLSDKFDDNFEYAPGDGNSAIQNLLESVADESQERDEPVEISLREAVYTSNNVANTDNQFTIRLIEGTYSLGEITENNGPGTQKDIVVTNNLTIEGSNETQTVLKVDVNKNFRAFHIDADGHNVNISNLTITGGSINGPGALDGGGALRIANGSIKLEDVTLHKNTAQLGGGIFIYGGNLEFINGHITENTADGTNETQGLGGGIAVGPLLSETTVDGTYFEKNKAHRLGGGIGALSPISLANTEFFDNASYGDMIRAAGGAVAAFSDATIHDSIINQNYSKEAAGGVYARSDLTISNSNITKNTAETFGGGILFEENISPTITNKSTITKSTIHDNQANENSGGGIYTSANTSMDINDSIISDNRALADSTDFNGYGAGLIAFGQANINNSTFEFNRARAFSGIAAFDNAEVNVFRTTFFNNEALVNGGALGASDNADVSITNATMYRNQAAFDGSALYKIGNSDITVANSIFDRGGYELNRSQIFNANTGAGAINSKGYNLIIGNNNLDPTDFPGVFNQHHTDLVGKNKNNKDFDANLANTLNNIDGSHSRHLIINPANIEQALSDAVDAGGNFDSLIENEVLGWRDGIFNVDAFGNHIDAFVDIGAVEYVHTEQPTKLFWIDKGDNSIWRMNADETGLQKIVPEGFKHGETREYIDLDYDPNTGTLFTLQSYNTATTTYEISYVNADGSTPNDMTPLVFQGTGYSGANPTAPRAIDVLPTVTGSDSFLYVAQNTESPSGSLAENYISKFQISIDSTDSISNISSNWTASAVEITLPTTTIDGGTIDSSSQITSLDVSLADGTSQEIYVYGDAGNTIEYDILTFNPSVDNSQLIGRDRITPPASVAPPNATDDQTVAVYGAEVDKYFIALHTLIEKGPSIYGAYGTAVEDTENDISISDIAFDYNYDNDTSSDTHKNGRIWYVDDAGIVGHITGTLEDKTDILNNTSLTPTKLAIASIVAAPVNLIIVSDGGDSTSSINVEENQTAVTNVRARPAASGNAPIYEISGGADAALFNIDASSGTLTFLNAPDFTTPTDANTDGVYEVNVRAYDIEGEEDFQQIAVTVTNVNDNPIITSLGGGDTVYINADENQILVTGITADDPDPDPDTFAYSLSGADSALFSIDSDGVLTFKNPPNFETDTGSGPNGEFEVTVSVDDGDGGTDSQNLIVTLSDVNEKPIINNGNQVDLAAPENQLSIATVPVADPDEGDTLTFSIVGGDDQSHISIDPTSGLLTFNTTPDYENPIDADASNTYTVNVRVEDAFGDADTQTVVTTVTDANDLPVITSNGGGDNASLIAAENQTAVSTITANDQDPDTLTYSLSGTDSALFNIDSDGVLTFKNPPNFETDTGSGPNGEFEVTVSVDDGDGGTDSQNLIVTLSDVNEKPIINNGNQVDLAAPENQLSIATVPVADPDEGDTLTFSIVGGDDQSHISIDPTSGLLTFNTTPDYENPIDADASNTYTVNVRVEDAFGDADTQTVVTTVTDANDLPVITSNGGGDNASLIAAENQTAVSTITANDQDPDTLTYSLSGTDSALFSIDSNGVLTFKNPPNFETDTGSGPNGTYEISVTVDDGTGGTDTQNLKIGLANVNEAPAIAMGGDPTIVNTPEAQTSIIIVPATDPDAGDTITYSIVGGEDQSKITIDSVTGALTFNEIPDYENPSDFDTNGEYNIDIQVEDTGGATNLKSVVLTITDINEDPVITSDGGGDNASLIAAENQTAVTNIVVNDPDIGPDTYSYLLSGADKARFSIDTTGALTFKNPPDFEADSGSGTNGAFEVTVTVNDGSGGSDYQNLNVTLSNVNEDPTITSNGGLDSVIISINENQTAVTSVTASDPDLDTNSFNYTLSGADSTLFDIDTTGVLSFVNPPDFERNTGSGTNGHYEITVTVDDGDGGIDTQALSVWVNNVNESPSLLTLSDTNVNENIDTAAGITIGTLSSADQDTGDSVSYSIVGGADADVFTLGGAADNELVLSNGVLDFETQSVYSVLIRASDESGLYTDQLFDININPINEKPMAGSDLPVQIATESNEFTYTIPPESFTDPENDALTYSVTSELPSWLTYDQQTRTFSGTPTDSDVVYGPVTIEINASDSQFQSSTSIFLTIELIDTNQKPIDVALTTPAAATQADPYLIGVLSTSDPDANDSHVYTITDERFQIVGNELKFAPNAENNFFVNEEVELQVVSTDTGNLTTTHYFSIRVSDYVDISLPPTLGAAGAETPPQVELEPIQEPTTATNNTDTKPATQATNTVERTQEPENQQSTYVEEVDLASLIAPLEKITLEEIALLKNTISPLSSSVSANQVSTDINNRLDFEFESGINYANSSEFREIANEFDRQREELEKSQAQYKTLIGSSFTVSSGLSVGYLLWLIRGGTLMGSVLSSLPAWRMVDPLPVLGALGEDTFEDEESLESMVDDGPDEYGSETDKVSV
jgi:hypothetical protein